MRLPSRRPRSAAAWAFAVLPPLAAAGIGGYGSRNAREVYARLDKPDWAPPATAFGPVWSALYALIGVAGCRLWTRGADPRLLGLHLAQLGVNAAWPWAFFASGRKSLALSIVGTLDAAVAAEVLLAARSDPAAAALLAPYAAWSGFATALNAAVSEPGPS